MNRKNFIFPFRIKRENQKAMIFPLLFVLSGNRELKSSLLVGLLPSGTGTSAPSFFLRICFSIVFYHFIEKNFFSVDRFFVEEHTHKLKRLQAATDILCCSGARSTPSWFVAKIRRLRFRGL